MSSQHKNLSATEGTPVADASKYKFGIVWSEWNNDITSALMQGARSTLIKYGARPENIFVHEVPGSFELTLGAQYMAEQGTVEAVICLGCVIQGETRHFDFICDAVANGVTNLNIKYNLPVIFGVLTPDTHQQAVNRIGGELGNKGDEAAITAIKMLALRDKLR
jgi:6,7-dimethyl-8-ribityllumazine synthase